MLQELDVAFRSVGPLGSVTVFMAAAGLMEAIVTLGVLAFMAAKQPVLVKVLGAACLMTAPGALGLGALGHHLALRAVMRAIGTVGFGSKAPLLFQGTVEARSYLLLSMLAALLPVVVGAVAMRVTRSRIGTAGGVLVMAGFVVALVTHQAPLPPDGVKLVAPDGLTLPKADAPFALREQPLVVVTPEGLWVERSKVATVAQALDAPRVRELDSWLLPLGVDARVRFSRLMTVIEEAGRAGQHQFELVVDCLDGMLRAVRLVDAFRSGFPCMRMTASSRSCRWTRARCALLRWN
jgi:hypothetical protein